ncbi:hypothetical protein TEA_008591 [Camellia sinensis var. sinensis]|uniref:Protein kinase domain-containing protein n=1 Tax=Camellia sinensis var. sinensis TaxID=542762 RepID=A0A4V3WPQ7_CAMSN|nr:hypothetical protein TEA_008591 [Camellia sinensis var. sinensis]
MVQDSRKREFPDSQQKIRKNDNTTLTIIIVVVSSITSMMIFMVCICIFLRKRKQRKSRQKVETAEEISIVESLQYNFDTISVATDNFSDANKLGQGGFGAVYRGRLPNGQEIAVKRLSRDSGQGELEFKNEVMLVAKLQHRNLVRLLGFCLEGTERLLIYEYVTNSSLDHFIFDAINRAYLDWDRRYKIIGGIARGLLYLHEDSRLRIIHRDLKASNVLLDRDMNAKISDFGMARIFDVDQTQGNTSRVVGTYGYMSPEYAMRGQFSTKSDVFSFGVLILEIVSGQRNNCFHNGENIEDLLCYAWKSWQKGISSNIIDPTLRNGSGPLHEMIRCIHIGLLCVQENAATRPTMAAVVLMLNSFFLTLSLSSEPAFFVRSSIDPELPLSLVGWPSGQGLGPVSVLLLKSQVRNLLALFTSLKSKETNSSGGQDTLSFGVSILEIVSGQKNNCFRSGENEEDLLCYAWKSWQKGIASNIIDPTLRNGSGPLHEMIRCIHIGLLCVQENAATRPTMAAVVLMLNSFFLTLSLSSEPAFFVRSSIDPELPLSLVSVNEASITELYPR